MNEWLQEKKKLALLFIIILFLLFGLLYVYILLPIKKEAEQNEITVQQLENEITLLQSQFNQQEEAELANPFFLEKKLPRSRKIDDLLLDLQQIEYVSNSRIESIDFTNYDGSFSDLNLPEATDDGEQMEEEENINGMDETANSTDAYTMKLPENVKYMTLQLSVTSPDFEHFFTFLEEVEKLERVVNVDQLTFSKPGEEELWNDETDSEFIHTEIQLTTFYYDS